MKKYLLLIITIILFSCSSNEENEIIPADEPQNYLNEYGFIDSALAFEKKLVGKNETLTDILIPHGITFQQIFQIEKAFKGTFDVRKIQGGKSYTLFFADDTTEKLEYFVYEKDQVNYVVFDFRDSINLYNGRKEITTVVKTSSGVIQNSLYQTLLDKNLSPVIALKLSEVFAWQIDFYAVKRGDYFRVLYEAEYIDTQFVGTGKILAAQFNHESKDFLGFYFDDVHDYFDEKGSSLRKAFLKAPLKFSRISSRFTNRRFHPILRIYRPHHGIDYAAPTGTPVQAVGDGTVLEARRKGGNGNYVKIRHNSTYTSAYLHLSRYGKGIKSGVKVRQGQVIGYVGSTGLSTGPHLDFRFYKNGTPINYLKMEFPPSKPLDGKYKEKYDSLVNECWLQLEKEIIQHADHLVKK
ncbi:MAG: peptidoglycan DD-metalloendopeptidase family protein [Ignavibacteria bacterium]|jgi:murein DD-endopeptidase MepM/ murein hydrolase activator NlpD